MYVNVMIWYARECTAGKWIDWYCSVILYVQGSVQMSKVWFKCSRFGLNVQGLVQNVLVLEVKEVG